jgi:hypothetical protein
LHPTVNRAFFEDFFMQSPTASVLSSRSGPPRALVLCVAIMLGFAVWSASKIPSAGAQETKQPPATVAPPAPPAIPTPPTPPQPPKVTEKTTKKIGPIGIVIESDNAASDEEPDDEAKDGKAGRRTITVKKNGKTVKITGVPEDDEIDAIGDAAKMNPSLAAMVVGIVAGRLFRAGDRDRADRLVPDAQGADAERDDPEARRARHRCLARNARDARRWERSRRRTWGEHRRRAARNTPAHGVSDLRKGVILAAVGTRDHDLHNLEPRRPERLRPGAAVRRHRLRRAVVVRAAAADGRVSERAVQRRRPRHLLRVQARAGAPDDRRS